MLRVKEILVEEFPKKPAQRKRGRRPTLCLTRQPATGVNRGG
jgi:hypothetical protein